jgi:hypothetical protein
MFRMAMQARTGNMADLIQQQAGNLCDVARQPILDMRGRAHGYELQFWNGREPNFGADQNLVTRTMLDHIMIFGLEDLARGLLAFVSCTPDSLIEEWVRVLPPKLAVLELSASVESTPRAFGWRWSILPENWSPGPWPNWWTTSRWISPKWTRPGARICFGN